MRLWTALGGTLLTALVCAEGAYLLTLRSELGELRARVRTLSLEQRSETTAAPAALATTGFTTALLHDSPTFDAARLDAHLRELVRQELAQRRDEEQVTANEHLELATEQTRDALSQRLSLSESELDELQSLGDELRTTEQDLLEKQSAGRITEDELHAAHQRAWSELNAALRRILGDARYATLEKLRQEHPEFARSLYALRGSPVPTSKPPENTR